MTAQLLHIEYGNLVAAGRVVGVLTGTTGARGAFSPPTRRLIADAREHGRFIDMTSGHRTKAVLVLDTGHVVLSAIPTASIVDGLSEGDDASSQGWHDGGPGED